MTIIYSYVLGSDTTSLRDTLENVLEWEVISSDPLVWRRIGQEHVVQLHTHDGLEDALDGSTLYLHENCWDHEYSADIVLVAEQKNMRIVTL